MSSVLEVTNSTPYFLHKSPSLQRKDQIASWIQSPTNKETSECKNSRDVHFSLNICFLSACGNGDIEDAKALLRKGANVNATNIDGITSLHQACLDDNFDVLEFLLQNNADINAQDLEGWTPLHAATFCGYANIAERLLEIGADPGIINSNGELPIDLAEDESVSTVLRKSLQQKNIDVEEARDRERLHMLADISELRKQNKSNLKPADFGSILEPVTKATPLHVAAAKGYIDVMSVLLECSSGILETKDVDGWTPLHAAAHWEQKEAVRLLCEAGANLDAVNSAQQSPSDLSEAEMMSYLRQLKEKFSVKLRRNAARSILDNAERKSTMANRRSSVNRLSMDQKMLMRMNKEKSPAAANMVKNRLSSSPLLDANTSSDTPKDVSPCLSPLKSPKSPLSPLTLPKMDDIFEEGQPFDINLAHSTIASHLVNACVLPIVQSLDPVNKEEEEAGQSKVQILEPRGSLRSFVSIESEGPSFIVHDEEPPLISIQDEDEPVRRRSSEDLDDIVPLRRSKINSLIVKSNESDWRLHRNAISEYDEESETVQRISLLMAPEKAEISESQRITNSRKALSNRRSTQGEIEPLTPKPPSLRPIHEVDLIAHLEALELRFADVEKCNLELRQQRVALLKEQELQKKTIEACVAQNEALVERVKVLEDQNATLEQQNIIEGLREENIKLRGESSTLVRVISRISKTRVSDHEDEICHKPCERCDEHFDACVANLTRL